MRFRSNNLKILPVPDLNPNELREVLAKLGNFENYRKREQLPKEFALESGLHAATKKLNTLPRNRQIKLISEALIASVPDKENNGCHMYVAIAQIVFGFFGIETTPISIVVGDSKGSRAKPKWWCHNALVIDTESGEPQIHDFLTKRVYKQESAWQSESVRSMEAPEYLELSCATLNRSDKQAVQDLCDKYPSIPRDQTLTRSIMDRVCSGSVLDQNRLLNALFIERFSRELQEPIQPKAPVSMIKIGLVTLATLVHLHLFIVILSNLLTSKGRE